jgi:hypothetical protein
MIHGNFCYEVHIFTDVGFDQDTAVLAKGASLANIQTGPIPGKFDQSRAVQILLIHASKLIYTSQSVSACS